MFADMTMRQLFVSFTTSNVVAAIIITGLFALVHSTCSMFRPNFYAVLWAFLVGEVLSVAKRRLLRKLRSCLPALKLYILSCGYRGFAVATVVVACCVAVWWQGCVILFALGVTITALHKISDQTLIALALLTSLGVVCTVCFLGMAYFCVQEASMAVWMIKAQVAQLNLTKEGAASLWESRHLDGARELIQKGLEGIDEHVNTTIWGPVWEQVNIMARGEGSSLNVSDFNMSDFSLDKLMRALDSVRQFDVQVLVNRVWDTLRMVFGTGTSLIYWLLLPINILVDFGTSWLVFLTLLFSILSSERTPALAAIHDLLPAIHRTPTEEQFEQLIQDVFLIPLKLGIPSCLCCFVIFWLLGLKFPCFASSLVFGLSVVPLISSYWVGLPWAGFLVASGWSQGEWLGVGKGVGLMALLYFTTDQLQKVVVQRAHTMLSEPTTKYMAGLSMVMGVNHFGVQGAFFGPLLVCSCMVMYRSGRDRIAEIYGPPAAPVTTDSISALSEIYGAPVAQ